MGLATPFRSTTLRDIAREVLAIARAGLVARRRIDPASGRDESVHLDVLDEIVASGKTYAERLLADWETHGRDIDRVLTSTRM